MPELEEIDDSIDFESNVSILPTENGKHWLYKLQHYFFHQKISLSDSQQSGNSILERSSSSVSRRIEERMCKELRYFFMNPCQKYKAKKRKPFKLGIQIIKIALVTMQLIIFGGSNQKLVNFKNDSYDVFNNVLLNRSTNVYTKAEVYDRINDVRHQIALDNQAHTGKIIFSMDTEFVLAQCPYSNATGNGIASRPLVLLILILDGVIIAHCSLSLVLCARSLWRGQRLRKSFQRFYWKRYQKKLDWFVQLEFFNFWYFLIIVSDVLTIMGSFAKIIIELQWEGIINSDLCSLFLGVGCLCVWIGVLRYAGFFHQYNILVLTLKKSLPHVLRFMVCASVLYLGFLFCGWVVLGPYHHKFRNLIVTSEAMFSLINGDDMYMTYEEMAKKSTLAWGFSQVYLYIFISLFIYIVLSLFIAVIMETYETIKEWQKSNFPPQNEIQRYLAEHPGPDHDIQYDYNSDTYCCCCLYHNSDPDIEYHSSDEEMIDT